MGICSIYMQLLKTTKKIKQEIGTSCYVHIKKDAEETSKYSFGRYGLEEYIFFDGREIRKIDNFPDTEEYHAKYNAYIKTLKCFFSYRNIEFIKFAFFGIKPSHYDWMKEYKYHKRLPEFVESQKINENLINIKDGVAHVLDNPTDINVVMYELLMIDKIEVKYINDNISPNNEFNINDRYMVPFSLQRYIYFNGREFCKKDNFPKRLEVKYDEYIKKLKCLYGIFILCQLAQMTEAYQIIKNKSRAQRTGRNSMNLVNIHFGLMKTKKKIYDKMDTFCVPYLRDRFGDPKNYSLRCSRIEDYIFFDGKEVRKIDNFPDSKELDNRYNQYIRELKYLFERTNVEFINYAFFGMKPTHFDWIKKYKYKKVPKNFNAEYPHNEYVSINKDGTMYIMGNPSKSDLHKINSEMVRITCLKLFSNKVLPYWLFKLKRNFDIPTPLIEYLYFDGKQIRKKDNFPKKLERQYELYIKSLNSLYGIFIVCQIRQMIGECPIPSSEKE